MTMAMPKDEDRKLRRRNLAVLAVLVAWCVLIFLVTIVKITASIG